jgi:hypothetical protein
MLNEVQIRGRKIFVREDREESKQSPAASMPAYQAPVHHPYAMMSSGFNPQYNASMIQYSNPVIMNQPTPHHHQISYPSSSASTIPADGAADGVRHIGRRLYVGNIPYDLTWQELKDHFRAVVPVLHVEIPTSKDGKSKGFGIVELSNSSDAITAIGRLNSSVLKGRAIFVREDRDEGKS